MFTFRSSIFKVILRFFWLSLVLYLILSVGSMLLIDETFADEYPAVILAVSLFLSLVNLLFHFVEIQVDKEHIIFKRFGRVYRTISMAEPSITSYVVKHYVNGIPSNTTYYIRVEHDTGKSKDYKCVSFSKKIFDAMHEQIYLLRHENNDESVATEETSEQRIQTTTFTLPKENMREDEMKRIKRLMIVLVIVLILFTAGICYPFIANDAELPIVPLLCFFVMLCVILIIVPLSAHKKRLSKIENTIPDRIIIDEDYIQIDSTRFNTSEMHQVKITPPSYSGAYNSIERYLTFTYQNKPYKFYFGGNIEKRSYYPEYSELCYTLEMVMVKHKQFIYQL